MNTIIGSIDKILTSKLTFTLNEEKLPIRKLTPSTVPNNNGKTSIREKNEIISASTRNGAIIKSLVAPISLKLLINSFLENSDNLIVL